MFYTIDIPAPLFGELNKNSQINQFFGKVYVGECMRLISDYYEIGTTHTQEGWQEYYKEVQGFEGLTVVFEELKSRLPNIEEQQIKKYIWHRVSVRQRSPHHRQGDEHVSDTTLQLLGWHQGATRRQGPY